MTEITFVYVTCREYPHIEWFIDSLYNQYNDIKNKNELRIQIVIVDYKLQYGDNYGSERRENVKNIIQDKFEYIHVVPLPDAGQGLHKLVKINMFSASLARNTGLCYAKYSYICFIDDLSCMDLGALNGIIECANKKIYVGFFYIKAFDLVIENGKIKSHGYCNIDTRKNIYPANTLSQSCGEHLYGYGAGPLDGMLQVNGYDQITDGIGMEDVHYGYRIQKIGNKIFYHSGIIFYESEDNADNGSEFKRYDPLLTKEIYFKQLSRFGCQSSGRWDPKGRFDCSHLLLDLLKRNKFISEGNQYVISDLRDKIKNNQPIEINISLDKKLLCIVDNLKPYV